LPSITSTYRWKNYIVSELGNSCSG
jgi:uncharacterized protein involved in tolerance to divalent cations